MYKEGDGGQACAKHTDGTLRWVPLQRKSLWDTSIETFPCPPRVPELRKHLYKTTVGISPTIVNKNRPRSTKRASVSCTSRTDADFSNGMPVFPTWQPKAKNHANTKSIGPRHRHWRAGEVGTLNSTPGSPTVRSSWEAQKEISGHWQVPNCEGVASAVPDEDVYEGAPLPISFHRFTLHSTTSIISNDGIDESHMKSCEIHLCECQYPQILILHGFYICYNHTI
jgi:hypothetical protein